MGRLMLVLPELNSGYAVGSFNLGVPYIRLGFDAQLSQILGRDPAVAKIEREFCATFLHEYVHFIQSVLFRSCQLQIVAWQNLIYSIYLTAKQRHAAMSGVLLPIEYTEDCVKWWQHQNEVYSSTRHIVLRNGDGWDFGIVDVAEGVARLIEEKYLGFSRTENQPPYTTIRDVNHLMFGSENLLSDCELLDLAEIALSCERPGLAFLDLCEGLKQTTIDRHNFYLQIEELAKSIGLRREDSFADFITENVRGVFTSSIFAGYAKNMQTLYGAIPAWLKQRSVFSSIYHSIGNAERGMPQSLISLIRDWGNCTPLIVNKRGEQELFSPLPMGPIDQHALVIESVVRCIVERGYGRHVGCDMIDSCRNARNLGYYLPVNCVCETNPWVKKLLVSTHCCPFGAVRRAFGLDGLLLD